MDHLPQNLKTYTIDFTTIINDTEELSKGYGRNFTGGKSEANEIVYDILESMSDYLLKVSTEFNKISDRPGINKAKYIVFETLFENIHEILGKYSNISNIESMKHMDQQFPQQLQNIVNVMENLHARVLSLEAEK